MKKIWLVYVLKPDFIEAEIGENNDNAVKNKGITRQGFDHKNKSPLHIIY